MINFNLKRLNMNKNIFKSFILLFVASLLFVGCEDDIVKDDYDVKHTLSVQTADASSISFSHVVFEFPNELGDIENGVIVADNQELNNPVIHTLSDEGTSLKVGGLTPETTYYYTMYGVSSGEGNATGEVKSFTTSSAIYGFQLGASSPLEEWQSGFSAIDVDGDGLNWSLTEISEGQYGYVSYSWYGEALTPNNYLLFPPLDFAGDFGVFNFTVQAADPTYYGEAFKLVISSSPITIDNASDAEILLDTSLNNGDPASYSVEIPSEYAGQNVYFALVHADVTDMYAMYLISASLVYSE
jgi:hypothetical protein